MFSVTGEAPVITVLGQRGCGKTLWTKAECAKLPRFVLWDTLGEYSLPGVPVVNTRQELFDEVESWPEGGVHRVIMVPLEEDETAALNFACKLCEAVGDVTLIVEEVDTFATPHDIPADLRRLLKVGRHFNVGMIFISRRPAEINRLITSQSRRFIMFRLIEPNDVRYLSSVVGALADEVKALPDLAFIDWQSSGVVRGTVKIPGGVV